VKAAFSVWNPAGSDISMETDLAGEFWPVVSYIEGAERNRDME
jgi:hypothetical protein